MMLGKDEKQKLSFQKKRNLEAKLLPWQQQRVARPRPSESPEQSIKLYTRTTDDVISYLICIMQKLEYHEQIKIVNDYTYLGVNFSASKFRLGRFRIPKILQTLEFVITAILIQLEMKCTYYFELYDELRKISLLKSLNKIGYLKNDKLSFPFNNTDPRISKLAAGFIFKATEKKERNKKTVFFQAPRLYL